MPLSTTLAEAKGFLRVADAAEARVAAATGLVLTLASPAPLRLAVLVLVAHAYEHRDDGEPPPGLVETWLAPYREARL